MVAYPIQYTSQVYARTANVDYGHELKSVIQLYPGHRRDDAAQQMTFGAAQFASHLAAPSPPLRPRSRHARPPVAATRRGPRHRHPSRPPVAATRRRRPSRPPVAATRRGHRQIYGNSAETVVAQSPVVSSSSTSALSHARDAALSLPVDCAASRQATGRGYATIIGEPLWPSRLSSPPRWGGWPCVLVVRSGGS